MSRAAPGTLRASVRRLVPLAWPVFVGQIAVLAFTTIDTIVAARYAAVDLAAIAVGSAVYATVFLALMGVVLAVGPIAAQLYGARRPAEAGQQLHQALWVALALSLLGSTLLLLPGPFVALSQVSAEVEPRLRAYLAVLALSLPAALLFTAWRGFSVAVSRPRAVMVVQLGGLAAKVPLTMLLAWGGSIGGWTLAPQGVVGCAIATAIAMWTQVLAAWLWARRDPYYAPFRLFGRALDPPERRAIAAQLRLGVPAGLGILVEVTGFTFMAIFIARLGTTAVAAHQIAANIIGLLFMMPLALGHATGALVAQRIGAGDVPDARRVGWHGVQFGVALALVAGGTVWLGRAALAGWYSNDSAVVGAALPMLGWVLGFHVADAAQALAAFVLRAWRVATLPVVIYAGTLWGVGLAGGYWLAFAPPAAAPAMMRGAAGFWSAATLGLVLASLALCALLNRVSRRRQAGAGSGGGP